MAAKLKVNRAEFAELAQAGRTNKELQEHFRVNAATISRLRKLTGTSTAIRLTPERKAEIEAMLADGWSHAEITRTEGADRETLHRHFPGTAWTEKQRASHLSTLRIANPRYNRYPGKAMAA